MDMKYINASEYMKISRMGKNDLLEKSLNLNEIFWLLVDPQSRNKEALWRRKTIRLNNEISAFFLTSDKKKTSNVYSVANTRKCYGKKIKRGRNIRGDFFSVL